MDEQFENQLPTDPGVNPPAGPKPSLRSRLLKPIVLIPAAGAAVVLLTVGMVSANTSKAVTASALGDLGDRISDHDAIVALMKSYDSKGRLTVAVEEGDLLPTDVSVDMWMNRSDSKFVLKANALGEDATLYLSDTDVIGQTSILSDTYGLNYKALFDDMRDCEWLGDYQDQISEMEEAIQTVTDQLADMKKNGKEAEKLIDKYYNLLFEAIFDNAKVSSTSESGNRVITIEIDGDCLSKSVDEVWKKAAKDKKLTRYLDANLSVEMMGIEDEYGSWKEILSDPDNRDDLCRDIERLDFEIKLQITAGSISHDLEKLKCTLEADGESIATFTLDLSEKNVTKIKLASGGQTLFSIKLTKDGDNLSGKLTVGEREVLSFKWNYEKKEKTYSLSIELPEDDIRVVLKGDYEASGKRFYLKARTLRVENGDETVVDMVLNVSLEIVAGEKTPDFPDSYKNVFDLNEDDLDAILDELSGFAEDFQNSEDFRKLNELFEGSAGSENYYSDYGD